MNDIVIKAENLGKKYIIGHQAERGGYTSLRDVLMQNARTLWSKTKDLATGKPIIQGDTMEEVWALKDVSFEIRRGEAVGIIGRNGAGKSTLLKILSRITEPSTGRVNIKGRVASLLEVGTGFHPELSGRENIYLNGTILGMTRAEIKRKFDEIVAFAEVERYLDTPVKRYSSGMYVRLAFAVAAHLEPEILVVDEVLAVGDAQFQKKCLGKMSDVAKEGRTVLFVSHNMAAISSLCERAILLNNGGIVIQGDVQSVISKYLQTSLTSCTERKWTDENLAPGNEFVRILGITLKSIANEQINYITTETPFILQIVYENLRDNTCLNLSIHLFNEIGIKVFNSFPEPGSLGYGLSFPKSKLRTDCSIPGNFLNDGRYSLELHVVEDRRRVIFSLEDALVFDVHEVERTTDWTGKWTGVVRSHFKWQTIQLCSDE